MLQLKLTCLLDFFLLLKFFICFLHVLELDALKFFFNKNLGMVT